MSLNEWIGTLKGCSLTHDVSMEHENEGSPKAPKNTSVYQMREFVQQGMLAWIRNTKGEIRNHTPLRQSTQNARKTLPKPKRDFENVKSGPATSKPGARSMRWSPYEWQRKYAPHFDRFLEYTGSDMAKKLEPTDSTPVLSDGAIVSVLFFSDFYLDNQCYEEARQVLQFVMEFYHGQYRFSVGSRLARAYQDSPEWSNYLEKAESLLLSLRDKARQANNVESAFELSLDLVNSYRNRDDPRKAGAEFQEYLIYFKQPEHGTSQGLNKDQANKLALQARIEDAKVKKVAKDFESAKHELRGAEIKIKEWLKGEERDRELVNVEQLMADMLCESGKSQDLLDAKELLGKNLTH